MFRAARATVTACWTTLLLAGVPIGLYRLTVRLWHATSLDGDTVARLAARPLTLHTMLAAALAAAWLLWAGLAYTYLSHARRRIRRLAWLPRPHLPGPLQALSATTLGVYALTGTAAAAATPAALPAATPTTTAVPTDTTGSAALAGTGLTALTTVSTGDTGVWQPAPDARPATATPGSSWRVRRGDTLWHIAGQSLGDPLRWREVYQLNRARYDRHGQMRGGQHIEPGWVLTLPARAQPQSTQPAPPPPAADGEPGPGGPAQPAPSADPAPAPQPSSSASPDCSPPSAAAPSASAADDDGLAGPNQSGRSGTALPSTTPPQSPSSRPARPGDPRGIDLPGGGWMDLGLATAVAATATLLWRQRSRRYTRRPPTAQPRTDDPQLAALPPVVTAIRHRLNHPHNDDTRPDDPVGAAAPADPGDDSPAPSGDTPLPTVPALQGPAAGGWPAAGLGLTGPGAAGAARGFLIAALTNGGPDQPATRVITTTATAATLLDTTPMPHTPRLDVVDGLDQALHLVEEVVLRRSRQLWTHDVNTVSDLPDTTDSEATPPVLLIAQPSPAQRSRVAALLAQGRRLDIHGILLGAWPDGDTINVADDGTTTTAPADHPRQGGHPADPGRLTVLTAIDTADLLGALAETHGASSPRPPHTNPSDPASAAPGPQPPGEPRQHPRAAPAAETIAACPASDTPEAAGTGAAVPVRVTVLGGVDIPDAEQHRSLRAKARELLVYLAVHDGNAHTDNIIDDLLPDALASKAAGRLHTYVSDLRSLLRHTGGPGIYLTHPGRRYALNPDTVHLDLWRMRAAIRHAEHEPDPAARAAALRTAVDAYRGPLAHGHDYEWVEPHREGVRRQYLDALLALTDLLSDRPAEQLALLEPAIETNPYTEQLYRAAMHAHARLGDLTGVESLRRTVSRRMAELDTVPDQHTLTLAEQLTNRRQPDPSSTVAPGVRGGSTS